MKNNTECHGGDTGAACTKIACPSRLRGFDKMAALRLTDCHRSDPR